MYLVNQYWLSIWVRSRWIKLSDWKCEFRLEILSLKSELVNWSLSPMPMPSIIFNMNFDKVLITNALFLYLYHKKIRQNLKILLLLNYNRYMAIFTSKIFHTSQSNINQKINSLFYFKPTHLPKRCFSIIWPYLPIKWNFQKNNSRFFHFIKNKTFYIIQLINSHNFFEKIVFLRAHFVSSWGQPICAKINQLISSIK